MQILDRVATNFETVKDKISQAERTVGREPKSLSLIAVTKTHDAEVIQIILDKGQRIFAENRVQEATRKWPLLKAEYSNIELHLIGPLQTNKVRDAVAFFDVIQSLDRLKLAESLSREMKRIGRFPKCLIQINTGAEVQKAGIMPWDADEFIKTCFGPLKLPILGLMCIPPFESDPTPHFELLREIAARHHLKILSMGMSRDYELAIRHGATHVRIGTAIFGQRLT